jgi:archaellum component FlaF (FlaF/FlaG flagellin family)
MFSKFYNSSEQLAVDRVNVLFEGRVVLEQCISKKLKHGGIKHTNYATPLDTCDIEVFLGKD